MPGQWQGDDLRERARLCRRYTPGTGERRPAWSRRVARNDVVVRDRAVLDVSLGAPGAVRENLAPGVAVFGRVGIDEQRCGAFPFGGEGLEAPVAVGVGVTNDHDPALDAGAIAPEHLVVFRIAPVRVHEPGPDIGGSGGAEGRAGVVRVAGGRIG